MRHYLVLSIIILLKAQGFSQVITPGSELWNYSQVYNLQNDVSTPPGSLSIIYHSTDDSLLYWNPWDRMFESGGEKSFHILPVRFAGSINSQYPRGFNDGPVWEGKGGNFNLSAGFMYENDWLRLTFYPVFNFAQNSAIYIPDNRPGAPFNYPFTGNIDWVQSYGDGSYNQLSPGQTEVRFVYRKFTLGVTTANETWGPAKVNSILMGSNSAGVPRIDLGTDQPLNIKIGHLSGKMFWGMLNESDYYDNEPANDQRYLAGLTLAYQPSFLRNLTLSAHRVLYRNWFTSEYPFEIDDFAPMISTFFSNAKQKDTLNGQPVNDFYDQMASVAMQWRFPEVGFEAYVEFARNDFSGNLVDFLLEPEHSRGYTLGFLKTIKLDDEELISINYEHTNLSRSKSYLLRATPPYYQHHIVRQGYTYNGQILGSFIGPGSNMDHLRADYYQKKGVVSLLLQRIRFNDDYFFALPTANYEDHDVEYTLGVSGSRIFNDLILSGEIQWSRRFNWYYESERDINNWRLSVALTKRIGSF